MGEKEVTVSPRKRRRKLSVLVFLEKHRLAFSPIVIYRNLRVKHGVEYTRRMINKYLDQHAEDGLVKRIAAEPLGEGKLCESDEETQKNPYYVITDEGIEVVEGLRGREIL